MRLSRYLEHTLLRAPATPDHVEAHCADAADAGLFGVCVSPVYVSLARECLAGSPLRIVTVVGFPLGTSTPMIKAEEALQAIADGAHEVDMVMAIGLALGGGWSGVEADMLAVREAIPDHVLKVILETGYLNEAEIVQASRIAASVGADFVKTSTGFGPRGATVADVRLMIDAVGGRAEVKAAGGIRTAETAIAMIEAGATRIGTSNGAEIARSG